jgi:hypothetical protein
MTIVIDATPGGAAANALVTELEQIAYMATRLNASAWTTITGSDCTETEKAAMIEAARELQSLDWSGARASATQALAWPRWYVINPDIPWSGAVYYESTIIPQRVKDAAMELAFQFLNLGTTDLASLDSTLNVKRKKVDVLETEYVDPWRRPTGLARFPRIVGSLKPLLCGSGGLVGRVVRG